MSDTLSIARRYIAGGLSVLPLRLDGSKSPAIASWKPYQERLATDDELQSWFTRPSGIGIACGAVSGGLEVLDFDEWYLFQPWLSLIPEPLRKLPTIETGGGGFQVYYRCPEITGCAKLAMSEPYTVVTPDSQGNQRIVRKQDVRIETRGQGGYVVAPGSPPSVHKSGQSYWQLTGPELPQVPTITPAARELLWKAAREFDCRQDIDREAITKARRNLAYHLLQCVPSSHEEPWEWYDRLAPWKDILEPHGWTSTDGIHWRKPAKKKPGFSAVVRDSATSGNKVLIVFSTSAGPLSPTGVKHRTVGAFEAYKILNHGGDAKAATIAIGSMMKGCKVA